MKRGAKTVLPAARNFNASMRPFTTRGKLSRSSLYPRNIMPLRSLLVFAAALTLSTSALAHGFTVGDLRIGHPFARVTVPGQPSGAAYMTIENTGKDADNLVAVASPMAKSAELHSMTMDGNVMKMREVRGIEIKPSAKVSLKPGDAFHIMLIGLSRPLKAGDKFPLTLTFEKAGKVEVSVVVQEKDREAGAPAQSGAAHTH
jgi:copper(I)-binding protein